MTNTTLESPIGRNWPRLLRRAGVGWAAVAMTLGLWAQEHQHHGPMSKGMMGEGRQDMNTIHALFAAHQGISRTVKKMDNGVETLTEANDPKVQALIRTHVAAMYRRLTARQPIRLWDPLYAELFRQADRIKMEMSHTAKGIRVIETSTDPWVVKLLHSHADGVSEFIEQGMAAMHKEHPLPAAAPAPSAPVK